MDFEPYRGELLAFCYRMLGSFHEAEDVVQETLLRAWKARGRYDPARASVRTWLCRIATNACLTALEGRGRRPLPSGLGAPSDDPEAPLAPALDVLWMEPFPDARFDVQARADLRLAWVAAVQVVQARQRAVLVLRDVLEFTAAEVAEQLGTTVAAVNSTLQRARATVAGVGDLDAVCEPDDPEVRAVIQRYVRAFEAADVPALVRLLADDAVLEMPPVPLWYRDRSDYGLFLARVAHGREPDRRVPAADLPCRPRHRRPALPRRRPSRGVGVPVGGTGRRRRPHPSPNGRPMTVRFMALYEAPADPTAFDRHYREIRAASASSEGHAAAANAAHFQGLTPVRSRIYRADETVL